MSGGIDLDLVMDNVIATLQTIPPFDTPAWATKRDGSGRIQKGFGPELEAWGDIKEPEGIIVSIFPITPETDSAYGGVSEPSSVNVCFKVPLLLTIKVADVSSRRALVGRALQYGQAALGLRHKNLGTSDCEVFAFPGHPTMEPVPFPREFAGAGPELLLVRFDLSNVWLET